MTNLKVLQKRMRILLIISMIMYVLAIVFAVLSIENSLLRGFSLILVALEIFIQYYIRKKCTCKRCGHVLRVKDFLELEDWNCPYGGHKMC